MSRINLTEKVFRYTHLSYHHHVKYNLNGDVVGSYFGFDFQVIKDPAYGPGIMVWISKDNEFIGYKIYDEKTHAKRIHNFCNKFAHNPDERKIYLKRKDFSRNPDYNIDDL